MQGNFVAKHMRSFNKGAGAHTNQKKEANNTWNLQELLDDDFEDIDEGWDFKNYSNEAANTAASHSYNKYISSLVQIYH